MSDWCVPSAGLVSLADAWDESRYDLDDGYAYGLREASDQLRRLVEIERMADVMSAGDIKIYITDTDGLICGEPNCPTDGVFDFPHPRGRTLAELTIMIVTHTNEHHAPAGFVNHIRPVAQ